MQDPLEGGLLHCTTLLSIASHWPTTSPVLCSTVLAARLCCCCETSSWLPGDNPKQSEPGFLSGCGSGGDKYMGIYLVCGSRKGTMPGQGESRNRLSTRSVPSPCCVFTAQGLVLFPNVHSCVGQEGMSTDLQEAGPGGSPGRLIHGWALTFPMGQRPSQSDTTVYCLKTV